MDYDLYMRVIYHNHKLDPSRTVCHLPRDKPRIFTRESIKHTIPDIDNYIHYPDYGDIWVNIQPKEGFLDQILPLNCFLYHRSPLISYSHGLLYKCKTNDKSSPLYKLTFGRDTFANILINLDYFVKQYKIHLDSDIKIPLFPNGWYDGLFASYIGLDGKSKKFIVV